MDGADAGSGAGDAGGSGNASGSSPPATRPPAPSLGKYYADFYYRDGRSLGSVQRHDTFSHHDFSSQTGRLANVRADSGTVLTAQEGDTLSALAQRLYGDASLWYVLAEANGLPDRHAALPAGTLINAPAVVRNSNTFATFSPYDPGERIGQMSPAQVTPPPPPSKGGCGALGTLIMVVVAVAVTVATAGATAAALGATATTATGAAAGTAALGSAALTGGAFASGVTLGAVGGSFAATSLAATFAVSAAVGAAAGSIASQVVGLAIGAQDRFSWRQVGLSALGAAVTSGLGSAGVGGKAFNAAFGSNYVAAAASAAIRSTVTQGLGSALGMQSFNWKAVAVSAIAAPLTTAVGEVADTAMTGWDTTLRDGIKGTLSAALTQRVRMQVYSNGKLDWSSFAADAFGNAIGNSVVAEMQESARWNSIKQEEEIARQADNPTGQFDNIAPTAAAPNLNMARAVDPDPVAERRRIYGADGDGAVFDGETGGRSRSYSIRIVQRGDSWSKIVGSNPAAIGLAMLLNGRSNSTVYAGEAVVIGSLADYSDSGVAQAKQIGVAALRQDRARLDQLAEAKALAESASMYQREINRFAALASTTDNTAAGAISAAMQSDPRLTRGTVGYSAAELAEYRRTSGGFEPDSGWPTPADYAEGKTAMRALEMAAAGKKDPTWAAAAAAGITLARTDSPFGGAVVKPSSWASISAEARAARETAGLRDAELTISFGASPTAGETTATATGKTVHRNLAEGRRASGDYDLVNQPIRDSKGTPVEVPRKIDLSTGMPKLEAGKQSAIPDAVIYRDGVIIDDKPLGRPIAKDRQEIIRFINAYEQAQGQLPTTIAIQRYDPATGQPMLTELYRPSDFLPPKKR
jgi:phage tail protein X